MLVGIGVSYFVFVNFPDKQAAKEVVGYISIQSLAAAQVE